MVVGICAYAREKVSKETVWKKKHNSISVHKIKSYEKTIKCWQKIFTDEEILTKAFNAKEQVAVLKKKDRKTWTLWMCFSRKFKRH